MPEMYIHMGSFGRPHGIRGEIALDWYGDSPFSCDLALLMEHAGSLPVPLSITSFRSHNGRLLVRIEGVDSRDEAESFKGRKVLLLRKDLPELAEDEAYLSDLTGAQVFLEDGSLVGRFSHLIEGTGRCVWSIVSEKGYEILFPAEPEFIVRLDPGQKKIIIAPPEGLLELYR